MSNEFFPLTAKGDSFRTRPTSTMLAHVQDGVCR